VGIKSVPFSQNRCHYRLYCFVSFQCKAALETKAALELKRQGAEIILDLGESRRIIK
jgi:hypothetical protein